MASKLAKAYLASLGIVLRKPHNALELANFAAGRGTGRYSLPYHVIRMSAETGDSKTTVGYAATLERARADTKKLVNAHGIENEHWRFTYYIRDIRNGNIYRV